MDSGVKLSIPSKDTKKPNDCSILEKNSGFFRKIACPSKFYEWEIWNFLGNQPEEASSGDFEQIKHSANFRFMGHYWYLTAFAKGTENHLTSAGVSLIQSDSDDGSSSSEDEEENDDYFLNVSITWSIAVLNPDQSTFKVYNGRRGYKEWIRMEDDREQLLLTESDIAEIKTYDQEGSLTLICGINFRDKIIEEVSVPFLKRPVPSGKLLQDLEELYLSGSDSDITIRVKNQEFPAHKCILGARTPVFASMFKHQMTEKATGIVTIADCEADIFRAFLLYVYTGTTENLLSTENVFGLYEVADKYQVNELKEASLQYIKGTLSVDTFCDVITLALKHNERELVKLATNFFSLMLKDIIMTVKWQIFMSENSTEANELLIKAVTQPVAKFSEKKEKEDFDNSHADMQPYKKIYI